VKEYLGRDYQKEDHRNPFIIVVHDEDLVNVTPKPKRVWSLSLETKIYLRNVRFFLNL
jgi:hypothetical protein